LKNYKKEDKRQVYTSITLNGILVLNMPSKFEARKFLLTYPKCNETKEALKEFLQGIKKTKFVKVCKELHEDGDPHLHAVVAFESILKTNERGFDFNGNHPNIQIVGKKKDDWVRVVDYVGKDGDSIEEGRDPFPRQFQFSDIINCTSRDEAWEMMKANRPRDALMYKRNFDYYMVCFASWLGPRA